MDTSGTAAPIPASRASPGRLPGPSGTGLASLGFGRRAMGSERRILRCAIYTRKSSEHGLEQDFNSLHAQRESAEAYIKSQAHEGWKLVRTHLGTNATTPIGTTGINGTAIGHIGPGPGSVGGPAKDRSGRYGECYTTSRPRDCPRSTCESACSKALRFCVPVYGAAGAPH